MGIAGCQSDSSGQANSPSADSSNSNIIGDNQGSTDALVRSENRDWVSACLTRVSSGATQKIDGFLWELCRKPNYYYGCPVHFTIGRDADHLTIRYKIHFVIYPTSTSSNRAEQMLTMAKTCMPQINSVWQRYGVTVDIAMDSDEDPDSTTDSLPLQSVWLVDSSGRSNSATFYVDGFDNDSLCRVMVHETGHHLGLEDEYSDSACPDRPLISTEAHPYSIMAAIWGMDWDEFEFYGRHVKSVFANFCGGSMTPTSIGTNPQDFKTKVFLGFPE